MTLEGVDDPDYDWTHPGFHPTCACALDNSRGAQRVLCIPFKAHGLTGCSCTKGAQSPGATPPPSTLAKVPGRQTHQNV
jgi:hypothetical protein